MLIRLETILSLFFCGGMIDLNIYNMKGQHICVLKIENVKCKIKTVEWDGNDDSGKMVGSGVYFYELRVNGKS